LHAAFSHKILSGPLCGWLPLFFDVDFGTLIRIASVIESDLPQLKEKYFDPSENGLPMQMSKERGQNYFNCLSLLVVISFPLSVIQVILSNLTPSNFDEVK
jgi:hypothetical protein